jgi:hypothetical protein
MGSQRRMPGTLPSFPKAMEVVQTLLVSFIEPFGRILVRQSSVQAASVSTSTINWRFI